MTRNQLENCIAFIFIFESHVSAEQIKEGFGVELTDESTIEEALTAYLEVKNIKLESEVSYE